ncbi:cytidylyltransferase domain-containing protein [Hymenobacter radiodurans]|uniref:cytidylyltransferase domain-containing protein n=1 Tax=Hymenobacter radiodurans TaxID=2496028 RepID=UPI0014046306|nr:glycosyltransferase family protein [Hymenobacter radiodurans]
MSSTRLPGKALLALPLHIPETTVLHHVIHRARQASAVHQVIVATSTQPSDDLLAKLATEAGTTVFRGDEQDVLSRFYQAAELHKVDVVIRLTGDNPAIDPAYIDVAIAHHFAEQADYTLTTGLPLGTNLEVISTPALGRAHEQATRPEEREHVTPYLRRNPGGLFRIQTVPFVLPGLVQNLRLTLDYPSDYALLHLLFSHLPTNFGLSEVEELVVKYPWLTQINHENEQLKP